MENNKFQRVAGILAIIILAAIGFMLYHQSNQISSLRSELASTTNNFQYQLVDLQNGLATTTRASQDLSQQIAAQQNRSDNIGQALNGIAGTVNTLQKLSQTDKELLQKYSKVYFLNENYVPLNLSYIGSNYLQSTGDNPQFHTNALPFLTNMLDDAARNNVVIKVVSAYRSFGTQASLKSSYTVTYGSGANKFSADQGYSEHQLGTAVDLNSTDLKNSLVLSFDSTQAFNWLTNNAYRYGFILSYPKNNAYYQYEPWHWRFVGVKLATYLHDQNKYFYDLDQRFIDTYLVNIFD